MIACLVVLWQFVAKGTGASQNKDISLTQLLNDADAGKIAEVNVNGSDVPITDDFATIEDLNRKLQINPGDAMALYRRGQLYAKNEEFSRAMVDFDATIRINPKDAEALNNRCWVRAIVGDLLSALQDCDASLQIKPDLVDSLVALRGFMLIPMMFIFPHDIIVAYLLFVTIHATWTHCNFGPTLRWLEPYVILPRYHHWHHTSQTEGIDKNFAIHFPWVDKIFGTYYYPDVWPQQYGLSHEEIAPDFFRQTVDPFLKRKKSA